LRAFLARFLFVVEWCFCWGFCEIGCANVVFLRGKCGAILDRCVAKLGGKSWQKKRTGLRDLFL
jgi:hypothetical protein